MRGRGDEGAVPALELVLLTPLALVLVLFVAFCGRLARTEGSVQDAARAAARAASLRADAEGARGDALAVVRSHLADHSVDCPSPAVDLDADLRPGGRVRVALSCHLDLSGLGLLGVPGSLTVSAQAVEVVDRYRAGPG